MQTYLRLTSAGEEVELSGTFQRDAINIAHVSELSLLERPRGCFVAGVRADYPTRRWCNFHIVQNKSQVCKNSVWIPHWPQPSLIPRDCARGSRIERVAYHGLNVNHYTRIARRASGFFRVRTEIQGICNELDLDLVERGPERWNDFRDVDVALGLRAFGKRSFDTKPPTKLIDAWLAGAVFIGGNDSAYKQVGIPGVDYLLAKTPAEVRAWLRELKDNAALQGRLTAQGLTAGTEIQRGKYA